MGGLRTEIGIASGGSGDSSGAHADLTGLDYPSSGHTGFSPTSHGHAEADVTGLVSDLGALASAISGKVASNVAISGATKTKITYDAKGLVTAGQDATTADIADSSDKRYCTDAQKTVIGNTSGTNSGDETAQRIGDLINAAANKTTPIDTDQLGLMDSGAANILKKLSWLNVKATLKAYFDTLYTGTSSFRIRLTTDKTYYVRTDGNDSNDGSADDAAHAFLTREHARFIVWDTIDTAGFDVTIQCAAGTYTGELIFGYPHVGGGTVTIKGVGATTIFTSVDAVFASIMVKDHCVVHLEDFTVTSSGSTGDREGIRSQDHGQIFWRNITFGTCAGAHNHAVGPAFIEGGQVNYSIVGSAPHHVLMDFGSVVNISGCTVTLTGTPTFTRFVWVYNGVFFCGGLTFSGGATGIRYRVEQNGVINTFSGDEDYFPGNAAGQRDSGGIYDGSGPKAVDVAYAAGNFTASTGTWTVESGDQSQFSYSLEGDVMTILLRLNATTLSNITTWLYVAIPGGKLANGQQGGILAIDPHVLATEAGQYYCGDGDAVIGMKRLAADMPAGANATYVTGVIVLRVKDA